MTEERRDASDLQAGNSLAWIAGRPGRDDDAGEVLGEVVEEDDVDRERHLSPETLELLHRPANTDKAYAMAWARYTAWCTEQRRTARPATAETLTEYIGHLALLGLGPATLDMALAVVAAKHKDIDVDPPDTRPARNVLRNHRKALSKEGWRVKKAAPLSVDQLRAMVSPAVCDPTTPTGMRNRALVLLGVNLMARASELAALSLHDIETDDPDLRFYIGYSKTDQDAEGRDVLVLRRPNSDLCAVAATENWTDHLTNAGVTAGALLRPTGRGGPRSPDGHLTPGTIDTVVQQLAAKAGLENAAKISAHSLRATGATLAFRRGAAPSSVARIGGWNETSPVLIGYWRDAQTRRDHPLADVGF